MPANTQRRARSGGDNARGFQPREEYYIYKCAFCHDWLDASRFSDNQIQVMRERHMDMSIDPANSGMVCLMHEFNMEHEVLYQCRGPCSRHQPMDCYTSSHRETSRFICHDCHRVKMIRKHGYWLNEHGAQQEYTEELPNRDDPMISDFTTFLDIQQRSVEETRMLDFLSNVGTDRVKTFYPPLNPDYDPFQQNEPYVSGASVAKAFLEKVGYLPSKAEPSGTRGPSSTTTGTTEAAKEEEVAVLHPVLYTPYAQEYDF